MVRAAARAYPSLIRSASAASPALGAAWVTSPARAFPRFGPPRRLGGSATTKTHAHSQASPRRPTYRRLVSTAGLRATLVVYRATSRILNVRFRAAEGRGPDVSILTTARNLRRRRLQRAAAPSLTQRRLRTHRGKVGRMR